MTATTGPHDPPPALLIAVCVITMGRPEGLERLVGSITQHGLRGLSARVELIVVDNDPAGSARGVCERLAAQVGFPIRYAIEARHGIPIARNRSVALIAPEAELAVFVDDDEVVSPGWLAELLRVQRIHDADVVAGAVLPEYVAPPPAWVLRGGFHALTRTPTGTRLDRAYTNNTLVRTALLRRFDPPFDERLRLTGGSDTHFFRRVHAAGGRLVRADEAVVYDRVPPSRATLRWILQRAWRYGLLTPWIEADVHPGATTRLRILGLGAYRVLKGVVSLPIAWAVGVHHGVASLRHVCYGAGMLAGLLGVRFNEYREVHGR